MVLPCLYDILRHSTLRQDMSHHPTRLQGREVVLPRAIRCVSPQIGDSETSVSSDGRNPFHGSDTDSLSNCYSYSVGPFAHAKSEGQGSMTKSLSKSRCWIPNDFTAEPKSWLGSGKFGSVRLYRTGSRETMPVALKVLSKATSHDPTMWKREVEIHTRYVRCFGSDESGDSCNAQPNLTHSYLLRQHSLTALRTRVFYPALVIFKPTHRSTLS
jgi:hypothetical protein